MLGDRDAGSEGGWEGDREGELLTSWLARVYRWTSVRSQPDGVPDRVHCEYITLSLRGPDGVSDRVGRWTTSRPAPVVLVYIDI